jgi:hypothetical protein
MNSLPCADLPVRGLDVPLQGDLFVRRADFRGAIYAGEHLLHQGAM